MTKNKRLLNNCFAVTCIKVNTNMYYTTDISKLIKVFDGFFMSRATVFLVVITCASGHLGSVSIKQFCLIKKK